MLVEPELIKGFSMCEYLEPACVFSGQTDKTTGTAVTQYSLANKSVKNNQRVEIPILQ